MHLVLNLAIELRYGITSSVRFHFWDATHLTRSRQLKRAEFAVILSFQRPRRAFVEWCFHHRYLKHPVFNLKGAPAIRSYSTPRFYFLKLDEAHAVFLRQGQRRRSWFPGGR